MPVRLNGSTSGYTELSAPAVAGNNTLVLPSAGTTIAALIPGEVKWFAMSAAPSGFLKANGAAISRTTYANLFAAIGTIFGVGDGSTTFNVPDLRGEFVRGWADDRAVDTGRTLGSTQSDAFQGHKHDTNRAVGMRAGVDGTFDANSAIANANDMNTYSLATEMQAAPVADGTNGTPRTAAETRPRNIALLACIAF